MVSIYKLNRDLNALLGIRQIPDPSRNGLQVRATREVSKVGLAVDAAQSTFEKAATAGCDMLIVHHGIFWKGKRDITGLQRRRAAYLKEQGLSLYAAHLPLDLHKEYGNNIELARMLGLEHRRRFGRLGGVRIGYAGSFPRPVTLGGLAEQVGRQLDTTPVSIGRKRDTIRHMAIVSGGGSKVLEETARAGFDCLLTGEAPHIMDHMARELGIGMIIGGHYQTEKAGVQALGRYIKERYQLPVQFINNPTII